MSASDRLLQLANDPRWHDHSGPQPLAEMAMLVADVMPEIVAAIRAAENQLHYWDGRAVLRHKPGICAMCDALAALNEKLADGTR